MQSPIDFSNSDTSTKRKKNILHRSKNKSKKKAKNGMLLQWLLVLKLICNTIIMLGDVVFSNLYTCLGEA